jgi:hypothetical protein
MSENKEVTVEEHNEKFLESTKKTFGKMKCWSVLNVGLKEDESLVLTIAENTKEETVLYIINELVKSIKSK